MRPAMLELESTHSLAKRVRLIKNMLLTHIPHGKSAKGHEFKEKDKNVGFATKTLLFNKKLTADLRNQTTFDFVVGGSYGPANKEYLAWYLDDVELIY